MPSPGTGASPDQAELDAHLRRVRDFLAKLKQIIEEEIESGPGYVDFLGAFYRHVEDYDNRLADYAAWSPPTGWGPVTSKRQGKAGLDVVISGPAEDDKCRFTADAREAVAEEQCVSKYHRTSNILARSASQVTAILRSRMDCRTDRPDPDLDSHKTAVHNHIRLLQQYNEIKDVGQQLMGLVSENRGVLVGSLYETGEFGVGPED